MNIKKEGKVIFVLGTIISILVGIFLGILWKRTDTGALIGIGIEIIVLILVVFNRLGEINTEICKEVRESQEILMYAQKIIETEDPIFIKKYNHLFWRIKELSKGRYDIDSVFKVYRDDKESIELLQKGEILRSTCVISKEDVTAQINDKFYNMSVEGQSDAVKKGIFVTRIYIFPNQNAFEIEEVQNNLTKLVKNGISVRIILRDDIKSRGIDMIDLDFIVFGQRKVSIGDIDPKDGTIRKARVFIDAKTVQKYIRDFETLVRISDEYTV